MTIYNAVIQLLTLDATYNITVYINYSLKLKFHAHVEVNSARLFQNVFNKCSTVLNLVFSRKSNFS